MKRRINKDMFMPLAFGVLGIIFTICVVICMFTDNHRYGVIWLNSAGIDFALSIPYFWNKYIEYRADVYDINYQPYWKYVLYYNKDK